MDWKQGGPRATASYQVQARIKHTQTRNNRRVSLKSCFDFVPLGAGEVKKEMNMVQDYMEAGL